MPEAEPFKPRDSLALSWLGNPDDPRPIGELRLVSGGRAVALHRRARWISPSDMR